ncbi:MAG TPA: hypothetical protein IAD20_03945 [Candidatus Scatocola faecipullorum]|uniref:Uncharacterized protein n=1 Tax=Candidatus Scatocola faecipullorum TaxID=2840917 RepID=A0A9D1M3N1_9PROT|nr:hypothetical protein [Candidatus Scatocola faecipullorum]
MLKKFLFENKLTLPARLLLVYLFSAIIVFPIIAGVPLMGIAGILFGREYSILPFAYSMLSAFCVYIPYLYLSGKFINTKLNIILIYVYLFLFATGMTIYIWMNTENGWQPIIFMMALMFYPSKYAFVSNLILLTYIIFKGKNKEKSRKNKKQSIGIIISFIYLCLAAGVPYFLKRMDITVLEKAPKQVTQPFNCCVEDDILKTKECVDSVITKKNSSFGTKWKNLILRFKNEYRATRHIIYNKNFIDITVERVNEFNSIKQCHTIDKCKVSSEYTAIDGVKRYDIYQNSRIITDSSGNYKFFATSDNEKEMVVYIPDNGKQYYKGRNYEGNIKQYTESKITRKKDVILSRTNGIGEFWAVGLEYIPLVNDNYLIIVSIPKYVEKGKDEYDEYLFEYTKGYKFYTSCKGKNCYEQDLEISLDSRENPSVIYVHFGDNVYKINIP